MRSAVRQIAAVNDEVRRNLPQIREDGLQGTPIAVNIRDDSDPHDGRSCYNGALFFAKCDDRIPSAHTLKLFGSGEGPDL